MKIIKDFSDSFTKIIDSEYLNEDLVNYLKEKEKSKDVWVKAFMKKHFCCGFCTTSRIEAKHSIFKRYPNSNIRLSELLKVFKELEEKEILKFRDEIEKLSKKDKKDLEKCEVIKHFAKDFSDYALQRLNKN